MDSRRGVQEQLFGLMDEDAEYQETHHWCCGRIRSTSNILTKRSRTHVKLGGGCELAMLCDILLCSPDAKFAQPEITLGIIPGAGGTQRLTHMIGKARAMDMVLTGRRITAKEAGEWGLVSRVTKDGENVVEEAVKVAEQIGGYGRVAVQAGKEAVNGGESVVGRELMGSIGFAFGARVEIGETTVPAALCDTGSERG